MIGGLWGLGFLKKRKGALNIELTSKLARLFLDLRFLWIQVVPGVSYLELTPEHLSD